MIDVECPGCGEVTRLDELDRSYDEFCANCDAPLFFGGRSGPPEEAVADTGALDVARRPGFDGRKVRLGERCPACQEPNKAEATYCRRCGADMRPAPPAAAPPPTVDVPQTTPPPTTSTPLGAQPRSNEWLTAIVLQVVLLCLLVIIASTVLVVRTFS